MVAIREVSTISFCVIFPPDTSGAAVFPVLVGGATSHDVGACGGVFMAGCFVGAGKAIVPDADAVSMRPAVSIGCQIAVPIWARRRWCGSRNRCRRA